MTKPIGTRVRTFAYGSNMLTSRIRERVPSATVVGTGRLRAHVIRWHKRSLDGSAKCDIENTGRGDDAVWGVLFELDAAEKSALDRAEGLGKGYVERPVNVVTDDGVVTAITYVATARDPTLKPYHWYKAFALAGAKEHNLPPEYIQKLEAVLSVPDRDSARAAQNERLLTAG